MHFYWDFVNFLHSLYLHYLTFFFSLNSHAYFARSTVSINYIFITSFNFIVLTIIWFPLPQLQNIHSIFWTFEEMTSLYLQNLLPLYPPTRFGNASYLPSSSFKLFLTPFSNLLLARSWIFYILKAIFLYLPLHKFGHLIGSSYPQFSNHVHNTLTFFLKLHSPKHNSYFPWIRLFVLLLPSYVCFGRMLEKTWTFLSTHNLTTNVFFVLGLVCPLLYSSFMYYNFIFSLSFSSWKRFHSFIFSSYDL